jgi:predicted house-cleaning noncanonical NTP pyrophosphatase (MazG superfamily)
MSKRKPYTIKNLESDVLNVWGNKPTASVRINRYTTFLLQKQIDEMQEDNFSNEVMDKELADMVLVILHHYSCQNKSSEEYIRNRLMTRHSGQTAQIKQKYQKLYRNYEFPKYIKPQS